MKIKVQAQHLKPGDIVGSGEKVMIVAVNSITIPSNKCRVYLEKDSGVKCCVLWGKYTMVGVERAE